MPLVLAAKAEVAVMLGPVGPVAPVAPVAPVIPVAPVSEEILPLAHWVSPQNGGNGAVRSLAEFILRSQGKWDRLIQKNYVEGDLS